ncbi:MAG: phosphoglycerate transporter [Chloroflexi bacterium]|nr:phosphoglycerate transporter [Chloroflexota bacterium]MCI0855136.1 phosphoglycerate transporter [Chloroflexota bacterium]MCI0890508.1 phosphoglycerate transporter [Chloroflexota bacterium]
MTLRLGWFSTGGGEGSQRQRLLTATVELIRQGEMDAEIAFVFCNRERGEQDATDSFLKLAESYGIPCITYSSRQFRRDRGGALSQPGQPLPPWRAEYDAEVAKLIAERPFDIGVLIGYMLIFTPEMAARYPFINLHPAEPGGPIGTWQQVIWELIDKRAERSGVMIHLATDELDRGPMVSYCTYSLRDAALAPLWDGIGKARADELRENAGEEHPLFQEIRREGAAREVPIVIATLQAFAQGRLRVEDQQVVDVLGKPLSAGLDLTSEVEAAITRTSSQSAK